MLNTSNYGLNKPEAATDNVNINVLNDNADIIDKGLVVYLGTTSGSGNAYTLTSTTLKSLTEGLAICVKFHAASTAACTLNINAWGAKGIKKPGGADVINIKAGMYTLRYDGTNFILQGEGASGDATESDLLLGKKATTDSGEIIGTLELTGDAIASQVPEGKTFYNTNPKNKVTGTAHIKATEVITPKSTDQVISAGQYLSGDQTIKGDPNLIASKLPEYLSLFGVQGTRSSKRYRSGTAVKSTTTQAFISLDGYETYENWITVTGLDFKPSVIIAKYNLSNAYDCMTIYEEMPGMYSNGKTVKMLMINNSSSALSANNIKGDVSPVSVYNGGFTIPVDMNNPTGSGIVFNWIAFE